jgi:hypothetical protein
MNARSFKSIGLVAALVAAGLVGVSCGGGGGDSALPAPPPTQGGAVTPPVEPAAAAFGAEGVLPSAYADPQRKAAFDRLNFWRFKAGVGALKQSGALDLAAQGHSDYLMRNGKTGATLHDESPDRPGFKGLTVEDRINNSEYGYSGLLSGSESVTSFPRVASLLGGQ